MYQTTPFYAPNFGKDQYCFRLVRPSVLYLDTDLKFHTWISHQKLIDTYFFKVWIIPLCGVMPLLRIIVKF